MTRPMITASSSAAASSMTDDGIHCLMMALQLVAQRKSMRNPMHMSLRFDTLMMCVALLSPIRNT